MIPEFQPPPPKTSVLLVHNRDGGPNLLSSKHSPRRVWSSLAAALLVHTFAIACTANPEQADAGEAVPEDDLERTDEPSLDVGSSFRAAQNDGPVGIDGGPVSLPVSLTWIDLEGVDAADVADGTVEVRLTNLTADTISALIVVERGSGIERAMRTVSTIVLDGDASAQVAVELLPEDIDLGGAQTSMNLRINATVVVGEGIDISEEVALGHYQSPTLYFHRLEEGAYKVYGEDALRTTFAAGLVDASALAAGSEVVVPEGVELEGVVVGEEN